jgi:hypothetical protein
MDTMSAYELMEWRVLNERVEPFGDDRLDLVMGILAASILNIYRGNRAPLRPADFIPDFDAMPGATGRDQTPDEIWAALDRFEANYKRAGLNKKESIN